MTSQRDFAKVWATLSRKVLASVLNDDGAVFVVQDIIGPNCAHFAPKERHIWQAVVDCLADNTPPTVEAVSIRVNHGTPADFVQAVAGQFNDDDNRQLVYNSEQLKQVGILAQVRRFGRELAGLDSVEDINSTVDKAVTEVGGILAGGSYRKSDGVSVSESAWQQIQKYNELGIWTGVKFFDDLTGGLWRGMNYWIVGPYKSGKTTLMRNAIIRAVELNNPVGVFCAEGSREMFVLDCQVMLATRILYDQGLRGGDLRLGGLFLKRYYWQGGVLTKQELDAVHEAREIWAGLPVHIWDTKDGIRNLATLRHLVKRARVHYGATSFWADYSQLFGEGGTIYERQSNTALAIQDIAQSENVALCMLSQKNEEGIRTNQGYSANVKGGGDAAAAADFLLMPMIDHDTPGIMSIELKFSRHTRTGSGQMAIAPASGLFIGSIQ